MLFAREALMDVQAELEREADAVARITRVARRESSVCFGELLFHGDDLGDEWIDRKLAQQGERGRGRSSFPRTEGTPKKENRKGSG
jgi:hypothetical protein